MVSAFIAAELASSDFLNLFYVTLDKVRMQDSSAKSINFVNFPMMPILSTPTRSRRWNWGDDCKVFLHRSCVCESAYNVQYPLVLAVLSASTENPLYLIFLETNLNKPTLLYTFDVDSKRVCLGERNYDNYQYYKEEDFVDETRPMINKFLKHLHQRAPG